MSAAFADFPVKARQVEADFTKSGLCLNIFLEPLNLPQAARYLLDKGYFLEDVTGLDLAEGLAALYHFAHWEIPGRVCLRVLAGQDGLPSLSEFCQGAEWHERETKDFYGLNFTDLSNEMPLLLPDDPEIRAVLLKTPEQKEALSKAWPFAEMAEAPKAPEKPAPKPKAAAKPAKEA